MKVKILKSMVANGEQLLSGDIVDASSWRHAKSLISNRYIALVEDESPEEPKKAVKKVKEEALVAKEEK
jgi:hypothetical protein